MEARHSAHDAWRRFRCSAPACGFFFIAHLGPIGAAMSAAFPILAIVLCSTFSERRSSPSPSKPAKIAEAWNKYDETVFKAASRLRSEIDKEEPEVELRLTDGPVAGLQFALQHLETVRRSRFLSLSTGMNDRRDGGDEGAGQFHERFRSGR